MYDLPQKTIKSSVSISGVGLHSGQSVTLTFHPAEENTGIYFRRSDLPGKPGLMAHVDYVTDTARGTTLADDEFSIATVEHVLAAISGLQLDNVIVEVDGGEMPIMDGSALPFVDKLEQAGIVEQNTPKNILNIHQRISHGNLETGSVIEVIPADTFSVSVVIDYDSEVLDTQSVIMNEVSEFRDFFANCRTFCFLHELEALHQAGLIKGGSLENAVVVVERELDESDLKRLQKLFQQPNIKAPKGILNNTKLRFPDEPARHKLLDVVGDLALLGATIKGKVLAYKPGHQLNTEFVKKIISVYEHSATEN